MEHIKSELIQKAQEKFSSILPYNNADDLHSGFSIVGNVLLFWFNTVDNSSHVVSAKI